MKFLLFLILFLSTLHASELEDFLRDVDINGIVGLKIDVNKMKNSSNTLTQAKGLVTFSAPIGENTKAVVSTRIQTSKLSNQNR